jgi:hypothetical protein
MNKIDVYMNPGILKTESGTYIVAGVWIKVPDDTGLKDISNYVTRKYYGKKDTQPEKVEEKKKEITKEVFIAEGSNGAIYEVKRNGEYWSCSCPGFGFNRRCKHISQYNGSAVSAPTKIVETQSKKIKFTKLNLD